MDSTTIPVVDETNPRQGEDAARAVLAEAERLLRKMRELRDDHRHWYEKIQATEQNQVDAIVREAADKILPEHIADKAVERVRSWVIADVAHQVFEHVMRFADVQDVKRVGKLVRAFKDVLKGK